MIGLLVTIGLLLQATALILLFRRVRGHWSSHIGAVFIILAIAYHGMGEILLWLDPNRDPYRLLISPSYLGQFVVWISSAILILTLTYLSVLRPPTEFRTVDTDWQMARIRRVFDWRLLLIATLPLMVLTVAGRGYSSGPSIVGAPLQIDQGLAFQFFLLLTPLASFAIIAQFGRRWFLPVLLCQSAAIAATGERLAILVAVALLLYALARAGISIQRAQLAMAAVSFILVGLIITSARAAEGRLATTAGGSLRLDYLAAGIGSLGSPTTRDQLAADLGYRLDGNSFGAMELEALGSWGMPTLGPRPLINDILLAIPSFLNPDKTSSSIEGRSEKAYAESYLGLPLPFVSPGLRQDILPTQLGVFVGFAGPWGLLLAALLLGAAFGIADRWLRRTTCSRFLVGVGLLSCVLFYERSWETYTITFRGILVLLPILWILLAAHTGRTTQPSLAGQRARFEAAG